MLFNVRAVWLTNKWQIVFSDDMKRSMKLAVRMSIWYFRGRKLNICWHSVTISTEPVRNNFMKMRVNEKSNECLSRSKRGQVYTALERVMLRNNVVLHMCMSCGFTQSTTNRPAPPRLDCTSSVIKMIRQTDTTRETEYMPVYHTR